MTANDDVFIMVKYYPKVIHPSELSDSKQMQLDHCSWSPRFYISVESWSLNRFDGVVYYTCELGIQKGDYILLYITDQRYSNLAKLDKSIKAENKRNIFPRKKVFKNTDVNFVRNRFIKLQKYMMTISKIPKLWENQTFRDLFHVEEILNDLTLDLF